MLILSYLAMMISHFFMVILIFTITFILLLLLFKLVSRKRKVKHYFALSISIAILCTLIPIVIFNQIYPTEYPYKDNEIIGSNIDEVIQIYGEPDFYHQHEGGFIAYSLNKPHSAKAKKLVWAHGGSVEAI